GQVVAGAFSNRFDGVLCRILAGKKYYVNRRIPLHYPFEQIHPVHPWHQQVQYDDIRMCLVDQFPGGGRVCGMENLQIWLGESGPYEIKDQLIIVDSNQLNGRWATL